MAIVLVVSLGLLVFAYAGYPLSMALLGRFRFRPLRLEAPGSPSVSVIIAARDEARVIGAKIESVLAAAPPQGLRELWVVDDGSSDDTAGVAARHGARVLRLDEPAGKAAALNAGAAATTAELLVFTDARQVLLPGALAALLVPFADKRVGAVSGELALEPGGGALGVYRRLDDALRRAEAASGSSVGVTGALWAIRRALHRPLPRGLILDDLALPLLVARAGLRVVVAPGARVRDAASPDPRHELRRRTRTLAGNWQLLRAFPWLLSPTRNPLFFRLAGHKLLRLAAPLFLALALVSNLALLAFASPGSPGFGGGSGGGGFSIALRLLLVGQLAGYGLAALPARARLPGLIGTLARAARAFVLLHVAATLAVWRFLRHEEGALWRGGPGASRPDAVEPA